MVQTKQDTHQPAQDKNISMLKSTSSSTSGGLIWHNLSVQTHTGTFLLQNCSGLIPNGHLCGLLGPSGAGKSTMLSALGGTLAASVVSSSNQSTASTTPFTGLHVSGDIYYHDSDNVRQQVTISSGNVSWLSQQDHFFSMLTVRETLDFAAFLELPSKTYLERQARVSKIMEALGISNLQHRLVGEQTSGIFHNGLSGGEKRRLSIAVELVSTDIKLFIGDEPTTGLDSSLSEKVVKLIKKVVVQGERNIPCLLSLHQPRSSIWRLLDCVIVLAPGGRVCYMGSTDDAIPYFAKLGYICPPATNPAEFLLDLVSIDTEESPQVASQDEARIDRLTLAWYDHTHNGKSNRRLNTNIPRGSNETLEERSIPQTVTVRMSRTVTRFGKLLQRAWRQNVRNHQVNAVRLFVSAGNAYFFTNVFSSVKRGHLYNVKTVPDRTALLSFGVINMAMMTVMKTIDLFAKEKPVVLREQQRCQYTSLEYLISKTLAEIPLDALFSVIFTTVLKANSGLRIDWVDMTAVFCLMTVCGASLGFAIGACSPTGEVALSVGVPLMVLLLGVGVITPSGIDTDELESQSFFVTMLKQISPIAYAIRAVTIAEYSGMQFHDPNEDIHLGVFNPFVGVFRKLNSFFRMGGLALVKRGDEILEELGIGDETYAGSMKHLAVLSMMFLSIAWMGLIYQHQQGSQRNKRKR